MFAFGKLLHLIKLNFEMFESLKYITFESWDVEKITLKDVFIVFIVTDVNSNDLTIIVFWIYSIIPSDRN